MRRVRKALLVAVILAQVGGCSSILKKDSSFVFGTTETGGEWLTHDCWNQRDAKDGGTEEGNRQGAKNAKEGREF